MLLELCKTYNFVEHWPTETIVRLEWSKTLRGSLSPWMIVEMCRGDDAQSSTNDDGSSSKQHSPERTKTTRNCRRKARRTDETFRQRLLLHHAILSSDHKISSQQYASNWKNETGNNVFHLLRA